MIMKNEKRKNSIFDLFSEQKTKVHFDPRIVTDCELISASQKYRETYN